MFSLSLGGRNGRYGVLRYRLVRTQPPRPMAIIQTRWKVLIDLPDESLSSLPTIFNADTGKSFIRTLGGRTDFAFNPQTLHCTNRFYDLLRISCKKYGFEGNKFPVKNIESGISFNFRFRLYGKKLLAMEIERQALPIDANTDTLKLSILSNDKSLKRIVLSIIGLIKSPQKKNFKPAAEWPKTYICNCITGAYNELPSTRQLVQLLTRHRNPSAMTVEYVTNKNSPLQSDDSKLLIDRQGILAVIPDELKFDQTVTRRFLAASNTLELIACTERMIEKKTLSTLASSSIADLSLYFKKPEKRFLHSMSSKLIWQQTAVEFDLSPTQWIEVEEEMQTRETADRADRTILIVTALESEAAPFYARMLDATPVSYGDFIVTRGLYESSSGTLNIYLFSVGVGNTKSAINTSRLLDLLRPNLTIFSGIAGGRKEAKIESVVVASLVYNYESGKETEFNLLPRPRIFGLSQKAESLATAFLTRDRGIAKPYETFFKPIACGEKLVGSTAGRSATTISTTYADALAIEMEGFGFLAAMSDTGIPGILIRGISDLLDNKEQQEDHPLAINNAADLAFRLIDFFDQINPASQN